MVKESTSGISIDKNFQTPIEVVEFMLSMVPKETKTILEPTPGIGNIVKALRNRNYDVTAPEDFFLLKKQMFDCILMNPPFSSKSAYMQNAPHGAETKGMKLGYYILKQCMEMSKNVIALMPWYTIADSDIRLNYLRNYGIKSLTHLPRKTFQYARIQTVIIELEKDYTGEIIFHVFKFNDNNINQVKLELQHD